MHPHQSQILAYLSTQNGTTKLSQIRKIPGLYASTLLVHHLTQLENQGYIDLNRDTRVVNLTSKNKPTPIIGQFVQIPIIGKATCGPARIYAEENTLRTSLKLSISVLNDSIRSKIRSLVAVQAVGNSMNQASISGRTIKDGDYVIINKDDRFLESNQRYLLILEGMSLIKRFTYNQGADCGQLVSESTDNFESILVKPEDNLLVTGKVVQVISI